MDRDTFWSESGVVLAEYGMILLALALVVFGIVTVIGGAVADMFENVLPGFGG